MKTINLIKILYSSFFVMIFFLGSSTLGQAAPAEFFYDAQGRLVGIKDENGSMAVHNYDPVGNLLSVDTLSPTTGSVGIFLFLPTSGVVGETVDIQGFGFNPITNANTVTINGVSASVISSSFSTMTVTIPSGATSGPVVVTNSSGTATSTNPLTILQTGMVLSIDPESVIQGSTSPLIIQGVNLSSVSSITFSSGSLNAVFLAAPKSTEIRIQLTVDAGIALGDYSFTLETPNGDIQSGSVTLSINATTPSWSMQRKVLSFFMPQPPGMPEGPSMTVSPLISVSMP